MVYLFLISFSTRRDQDLTCEIISFFFFFFFNFFFFFEREREKDGFISINNKTNQANGPKQSLKCYSSFVCFIQSFLIIFKLCMLFNDFVCIKVIFVFVPKFLR